MASQSTGTAHLRAEPVIAWLAVMLSGLVGLLVLADTFNTGGLSNYGSAPAWWSSIDLYVGFAGPAALVIAVGVYVARLRPVEAGPASPWAEPADGGPAAPMNP
jgi:type IV secretory pathway TraG/TraD family ATPase VirD4